MFTGEGNWFETQPTNSKTAKAALFQIGFAGCGRCVASTALPPERPPHLAANTPRASRHHGRECRLHRAPSRGCFPGFQWDDCILGRFCDSEFHDFLGPDLNRFTRGRVPAHSGFAIYPDQSADSRHHKQTILLTSLIAVSANIVSRSLETFFVISHLSASDWMSCDCVMLSSHFSKCR